MSSPMLSNEITQENRVNYYNDACNKESDLIRLGTSKSGESQILDVIVAILEIEIVSFKF